jgi:hypothetical protein
MQEVQPPGAAGETEADTWEQSGDQEIDRERAKMSQRYCEFAVSTVITGVALVDEIRHRKKTFENDHTVNWW